MALNSPTLSLLSLTLLLFLLSPQAQAQTPSSPAPTPSGPINITAILVKGGQYNSFIRFLTQETQVADQINNQLNNSNQGMTVFAPTDNAFNNLPAGTLNNLNPSQQVQLVQYHVLPRYYSLSDLLSVSNPVPTQAAGQDGRVYGLNFTGHGNQVNVSTGVVETQVNNALSQESEEGILAVYSVDQVLLPVEFYEAPSPAAASPPAKTKSGRPNSTETEETEAEPPASGSREKNVGLGLAAGVGLVCMGLFS